MEQWKVVGALAGGTWQAIAEGLATLGPAGTDLPSGLTTASAALTGLVLFWFLHRRCPRVAWLVAVLLAGAALVVTDAAENALGVDGSQIIADEFAAVPFLFLFYVPWRHPHALLSVVAMLSIFGALDILKPFGMQVLERLPGGFGVVLDDVGAAVATSAVARVVYDFLRRRAAQRGVEGEV